VKKVGGEYGHVGNGRQTQSLGEWMEQSRTRYLFPSFSMYACIEGEKERGDRTGQE